MREKKKYRLLRDIPGQKAGTIFEEEEMPGDYVTVYKPRDFEFPLFHSCRVENNREWFEPVDDRWRPSNGEEYFYIDDDMDVIEEPWDGVAFDTSHHAVGNCFQTHEEAVKASERVKALLLSIHKEKEVAA